VARTSIASVVLASILVATFAAQQPPSRPATGTGTVLITGSNRGLGLEFAKQYASRGWRVIATARQPEAATELRAIAAQNRGVSVEKLDVEDVAAIKALAAKYKATAIDVLINNAGVLGDMQKQNVGSFNKAEFDDVMDVNVFGALAVADAFLDRVAASTQKKIVSITSRSGIISQPGRRGPSFYRASKAALNMVMKVLADDVRDRGVIVALCRRRRQRRTCSSSSSVRKTPRARRRFLTPSAGSSRLLMGSRSRTVADHLSISTERCFPGDWEARQRIQGKRFATSFRGYEYTGTFMVGTHSRPDRAG
jgi:short-subunit dehydrogenase